MIGLILSIDFIEPTALYIQITNLIKSLIDAGVLNPGDQLESHQFLAKKYSVSLITVKKALNNLINQNYLFIRVLICGMPSRCWKAMT